MGLREWWNLLWKQSTAIEPPLSVTISASVYVQDEDPKITRARKAATAHGQLGDYGAAVADLERVHELETSDGSSANCTSEIRRAKYLQKAGRGEEAWQLFKQLLEDNRRDPWLLVDLLNAMRLHLQRENSAKDAIVFGIAMRLAQVKLYRDWRREAEAALVAPIQSYGSKELERLTIQSRERDMEICNKWLAQLTNPTELTALVRPLCKKAGVPDQTERLVSELQVEINRATRPLDYLEAEGVEYALHRN
jgi:tetratricopeptide (TPR) repeat protein